jgi:hypothetical protein
MKFTIPTQTKSQANYILSYMAKNTGALCEGDNAACDSVVTLIREDDNTVTASSNYFTSPWDIADRLPTKWANWVRENM